MDTVSSRSPTGGEDSVWASVERRQGRDGAALADIDERRREEGRRRLGRHLRVGERARRRRRAGLPQLGDEVGRRRLFCVEDLSWQHQRRAEDDLGGDDSCVLCWGGSQDPGKV